MRKNILILLFALFTFPSFSQSPKLPGSFLRLSGGSVSFGTGDFMGYSFGVGLLKNVIRQPRTGLDKLLVGGELIFESGVKNPVIQNPTQEEFFAKTFRHTSSTLLWAKAGYYPFKKIVKGFNIQAGPVIGYSSRSTEQRASRVVDILGNSVRQSTLTFNNGFVFGYRISTGIEFDLSRRLHAGFRLDFSNNNEAEINTLAGLSVGIIL